VKRPSHLLVFGALAAILATGYGVIFTVLDDYREQYGIGETALGGIIGIGFFSSFVAQILMAPLADRGKAKSMMLIGVALNVVGLLMMAVGTDLSTLLAGRFVMGVGIGTAMPAIRRTIIVADPENVGHNLGRLLSAEVAGFAAGPAISAVLVGPFGIAAPFVVVAALTAALTVPIAGVRVDERSVDECSVDERGVDDGRTQATLALGLLRDRAFAGAVVLGSAVFVMIGAFDALWAVVLDDLDTRDWIANLGISLFALPLIVLGSIGGRLAHRVGPFRVGTLGLLAGAMFMGLYGFMPTGGAIFAVAMFHAVSDGLTVASTGIAVALVTPPDRQAGGQGVLGGAQTLAAGVTALLVGGIYENAGRGWAYGFAAVLMLAFVAVGVWLARFAWSHNADNHEIPIDNAGRGRGVKLETTI